MTPARVPRREHGARAGPKTITDSPARKKSPPISGGPGSMNFRSPRPVRDWIRHGPGLR